MVDRRSIDINYSRGRRGRPWQRYRQQVLARETRCRRCGRIVNKALPYRDPRTGKVNKMSASVGHLTELDANGHPYNAGLEHLSCNSRAGAIYGNAKRGRGKPRPTAKVDSSADWS